MQSLNQVLAGEPEKAQHPAAVEHNLCPTLAYNILMASRPRIQTEAAMLAAGARVQGEPVV